MSERSGVSLRPAAEDDCRRLWEWRNDPTTRRASFQTGAIVYADHQRWFGERLRDPQTRFFIVQDPEGEPVGYVRFQVRRGEAEISVSIDRAHRGKGYGPAAIRLSSDLLLSMDRLGGIVAYVRTENPSSLAAFQRAGFAVEGQETIEGMGALRLIYPSVTRKG